MNFPDFKDTLYALLENELKLFIEKEGGDRFYGCYLDGNAEYGDVLLGFNTEEFLNHSAANLTGIELHNAKALGMDTSAPLDVEKRLREHRWSVDCWKFHGSDGRVGHLNEDEWEEKWSDVAESIEDYAFGDDEDSLEKSHKLFIGQLVEVVKRLIADGAFEALGKTDDFCVVVADHEDTEEDFVRVDYFANRP
jgi:hypothetical protein